MRILVVSKQTRTVMRRAAELARKIGAKVDEWTGKRAGMDWERVEEFKGDFIVTVGGDGTFLWVSGMTDLPILPVRAEGVGFLCTVDFEEAVKNWKRIREGKLERMRYSTLSFMGRRAVNEVVITRHLKSKILRAKVRIGEEEFHFKGDGFLLATSRGSTAYNLSLGGPVLSDDSLFVFTPIAPFMRISSIVLKSGMEFRIERDDAVAIIDGRDEVAVEKGRWHEIRKGKKQTVLSLGRHNHFSKYVKSL